MQDSLGVSGSVRLIAVTLALSALSGACSADSGDPGPTGGTTAGGTTAGGTTAGGTTAGGASTAGGGNAPSGGAAGASNAGATASGGATSAGGSAGSGAAGGGGSAGSAAGAAGSVAGGTGGGGSGGGAGRGGTAGTGGSCVPNPAGTFMVNGDVVFDPKTCLSWMKTNTSGDPYVAADAYCAGLSLGGHDDWRLPTAGEVVSIFKCDNTYPPVFDVFTVMGDGIWTTTLTGTIAGDEPKVCGAGQASGQFYDFGKVGGQNTRCVRGAITLPDRTDCKTNNRICPN